MTEPEILCDACGDPFTATEWVNRHTPGLLSLHSECCESRGCEDSE